MILTPFREPARLLFYMSEGYTRVTLERFEGLGMANGGCDWDIPTAAIPGHLRRIGSRFVLVGHFVRPEDRDGPDEMRKVLRSIQVEDP
jgi:hypothetical protein